MGCHDIERVGVYTTSEGIVQQTAEYYLEGDAVLNEIIIDGKYFKKNIKITKIGVFARLAPTGANLIIDQIIAGAEQSKAATLTATSKYEETDITDLSVLTTDRYGLKVTQIGSTLPGTGITIVIFYENL